MYNTDFDKHLALHGIQKKKKQQCAHDTVTVLPQYTADWYLMANNVLCIPYRSTVTQISGLQ